jgi:hypothetical protein
LLRKLKNTVTGAKLLHVHNVSQFSRQLLTPFESRFDFPDRLNLPKLMQRPKYNTINHRQRPKTFRHWATLIGHSQFE